MFQPGSQCWNDIASVASKIQTQMVFLRSLPLIFTSWLTQHFIVCVVIITQMWLNLHHPHTCNTATFLRSTCKKPSHLVAVKLLYCDAIICYLTTTTEDQKYIFKLYSCYKDIVTAKLPSSRWVTASNLHIKGLNITFKWHYWLFYVPDCVLKTFKFNLGPIPINKKLNLWMNKHNEINDSSAARKVVHSHPAEWRVLV